MFKKTTGKHRVKIEKHRYKSGSLPDADASTITDLKLTNEVFQKEDDDFQDTDVMVFLDNYLSEAKNENATATTTANLFIKITAGTVKIPQRYFPLALVYLCDYYGQDYKAVLTALPNHMKKAVFAELKRSDSRIDFEKYAAVLERRDTATKSNPLF